MEFRLLQQGSLLTQGAGSGSRVKEKHAIRRQLHLQLSELWRGDQLLSRYFRETAMTKRIYIDQNAGEAEKATELDFIAQDFTKFGYHFVPLIGRYFGTACSLDVLFLRRDGPGNVIKSGGDNDNPPKAFFSGFTLPPPPQHAPGMPPPNGGSPLFCFFEVKRLTPQMQGNTPP